MIEVEGSAAAPPYTSCLPRFDSTPHKRTDSSSPVSIAA